MSKGGGVPWHQVVHLRDDLRTGELSLAQFAADLYDVVMNRGPEIYRDPAQFFALTYPTFNIRELAKDVVLRLAGRSEKAVRQLELTYGGGKTHTLITLYHLTRDPKRLPDLPAVEEFVQHIGLRPPKARIAVLPFDKLDVEKGMEVPAPAGDARWLKHPWSVLAYQIAGSEGLRLLHAEGRDAERESPPAENLLKDLLEYPAREKLATLILIDEVLMYAREKVDLDSRWRDRLLDFFQYLTQAAVKVSRCAVVASLLATDPRKSDELGKEITREIYQIFRREAEEGVQPVLKEDVAEVLRRRFFIPDSIRDKEKFKPHVVAAVKNIAELDDQTRKDGKKAEDRFLGSYPFHPDLTEVLYSKWTQLEGFQRTRGVLRTFALALREAEKWDDCPLVGVNVFLGEAGKDSLAEAARELTTVAATEEYEGKRQNWVGILGELQKARDIQTEIPGLKHREIEQAVFTTFLHSQPIGQKASTRDLSLLLAQTRPDRIELEKGLRQWADVSWFLDEAFVHEAETAQEARALPKSWRLGSRPNLRQMHHDARQRVPADLADHVLTEEIQKVKRLDEGVRGAGAVPHMLPERPSDIEDDGEFHYAVLGLKAASEPGKPTPEAARFINETTSADRPRVHRNAIVLVVASRDGLEAVRDRVRDYLGWVEVQAQLKEQRMDPIRVSTLTGYLDGSKKAIPDAIRQAYCIAVTVSEKNDVQAIKISVGSEPLFNSVKADRRLRIQETAVSAEALLPGGPYALWREGEVARWVKDLVGAFATSPHLPKMLNRKAIADTLLDGCRIGLFVLRLKRPDGSLRTWWREVPDDAALSDPALEVVLPETAELATLSPFLLAHGALPGLWAGSEITMKDMCAYFAGGHVVKISRNGYEEPFVVPKAGRAAIEQAVGAAVRQGVLWLTSGPASILAEEIPPGLLSDDAVLQAPPAPISPLDVLPGVLDVAWSDNRTTALTIAAALSRRAGKNLPWATIRDAIDGALRGRYLVLTADSAQWPCEYAGAQHVRLTIPAEGPRPPEPPRPTGVFIAEAELTTGQIQDLADQIGEVVRAAAGHDLRFRVRVQVGDGAKPIPKDVVAELSGLLTQIVKDLQLK